MDAPAKKATSHMNLTETFDLVWMQRLGGGTEVLERNIPVSAAMARLQLADLEDYGAGGVCFLRPSNDALVAVLAERARQDEKWGEQNHDPFTYLTVLSEEVGEFAQAALHTRFGGPKAAGLREEAIHVAAVALAIVECIDRGKWRWPEVQSE